MSEPDRVTELVNALKSQHPWDAIGLIPPPPSPDSPASESIANPDVCAASLIALLHLTALLSQGQVSDKPLPGSYRGNLGNLGFAERETLPHLEAAVALRELSVNVSGLLWQNSIEQAGMTASSAFAGIERNRAEFACWVDDSALDFLTSTQFHVQDKLKFLQEAAFTLTYALAWFFLRQAVERWPAALEGAPAYHAGLYIAPTVQTLVTEPRFLPMTDMSVWSKLSQIVEKVSKAYPDAVRAMLIQHNAPCGVNPVAVLDPTSALTIAGISLVDLWVRVVADKAEPEEFDEQVRQFKRVRGLDEDNQGALRDPPDITHYTDFVAPVEGDGSWPASIPDVEYIVREIVKAGGFESGLQPSQQIIAPTPKGWVYIQTPNNLPLYIVAEPDAAAMHAHSPVLAWMMHASTNPYPSQNVYSTWDKALSNMREELADVDQRKRLKQVYEDAESVLAPPAITATAEFILSYLFTSPAPTMVAPFAAMVYPAIQVIRRRMK